MVKKLTKEDCFCEICGEPFSLNRRELGYTICLKCGEELAQRDRPIMFNVVNRFHECEIMIIKNE